MTDWDSRFFNLALEARSWVKGPDLGVGACIVSPDKKQLSLGYSGLPKAMLDTEERITSLEFKDYHLVHAELNAILNASRSLMGWTIYTTTCPCAHCASAIIQAGIVRTVSPSPQTGGGRWLKHQLVGQNALQEAGIVVDYIEERKESK